MSKSEKRIAKAAEISKTTMTGDLRDVLIDIMRDKTFTGKAWKDMKEDEQRAVRDRINSVVEHAVSRAVDIIASEGRRHIKVLLKSVTIKNGIKGSFETSKAAELRHELGDAQGDNVLIVLLGSDKYHGEKAPVKIDKDQPSLIKEKEDNATEEVKHDPETGEIIEDVKPVEGGQIQEPDSTDDDEDDDGEDDTEIEDDEDD